MFTVYAIHAPEAAHLEQVKADMIQLGAPKIEVVDCGDHYMALEGSHRLAAAHALGIEPELVIYEHDQLIDITRYDWYDRNNWGCDDDFEPVTLYAAGEVAGELYSPIACDYRFPAER